MDDLSTIYIRAKVDEKWGSHSLRELLKEGHGTEILRWFLARLGIVPFEHEAARDSIEAPGLNELNVLNMIAFLEGSGVTVYRLKKPPSEFVTRLGALIKVIKEDGIPALVEALDLEDLSLAISQGSIDDYVVFEALKQIGGVDHQPSYKSRFAMLVEALALPSPVIRDGAGLGLAYMDDPEAIPYVEEAFQREQVPDLKKDLKNLLDQLVNTRMTKETTNDT